jgi:NTE family protein
MIALLRQLANPGDCEGALWAAMRIHRIVSAELAHLGASSKLLADWEFFCKLRDLGRQAADAFVRRHAHDLGQRSTFDLDPLLTAV